MGYVASAIEHIGLTKLGNRLDLWPSGIQKWRDDDCLPQTELSGRTNYSAVIEEMSGGKFSAKKLLEHTRKRWSERWSERRGPEERGTHA